MQEIGRCHLAQLVFVHGVNTRPGIDYDVSVKNRNTLFREILFEGVEVSIHTPVWGDLVPPIPAEIYETGDSDDAFGSEEDDSALGAGLGNGLSDAPLGSGLANAANVDPEGAIDAIFATLIEQTDRAGAEIGDAEIDAFRKAVRSIESDTAAADFGGIASDDELAFALTAGTGAYGIGSAIKKAVDASSGRLANLVSQPIAALTREKVRRSIGIFIGDVFAYLRDGQTRQKIQSRVREQLLAAHSLSQSGKGPVIVIGHSMGGVILVDMLGDLSGSGLPADFKIKTLFTVGSQPGLFRALGVISPMTADQPKLDCVEHWQNVFDPIDPLAFRSGPMFSNVEDLEFSSATGIVAAHGAYFDRPRFHARVRARLREAGVL